MNIISVLISVYLNYCMTNGPFVSVKLISCWNQTVNIGLLLGNMLKCGIYEHDTKRTASFEMWSVFPSKRSAYLMFLYFIQPLLVTASVWFSDVHTLQSMMDMEAG